MGGEERNQKMSIVLVAVDEVDQKLAVISLTRLRQEFYNLPERAVAQTNRLPFDRPARRRAVRPAGRLRANGDILKSCDFSAHAELVEA